MNERPERDLIWARFIRSYRIALVVGAALLVLSLLLLPAFTAITDAGLHFFKTLQGR